MIDCKKTYTPDHEVHVNAPVCIPSEFPIPRIRMKRTRGASPDGGGEFFLSLMANTTKRRIIVPRNSSKKQETFVM